MKLIPTSEHHRFHLYDKNEALIAQVVLDTSDTMLVASLHIQDPLGDTPTLVTEWSHGIVKRYLRPGARRVLYGPHHLLA